MSFCIYYQPIEYFFLHFSGHIFSVVLLSLLLSEYVCRFARNSDLDRTPTNEMGDVMRLSGSRAWMGGSGKMLNFWRASLLLGVWVLCGSSQFCSGHWKSFTLFSAQIFKCSFSRIVHGSYSRTGNHVSPLSVQCTCALYATQFYVYTMSGLQLALFRVSLQRPRCHQPFVLVCLIKIMLNTWFSLLT